MANCHSDCAAPGLCITFIYCCWSFRCCSFFNLLRFCTTGTTCSFSLIACFPIPTSPSGTFEPARSLDKQKHSALIGDIRRVPARGALIEPGATSLVGFAPPAATPKQRQLRVTHCRSKEFMLLKGVESTWLVTILLCTTSGGKREGGCFSGRNSCSTTHPDCILSWLLRADAVSHRNNQLARGAAAGATLRPYKWRRRAQLAPTIINTAPMPATAPTASG